MFHVALGFSLSSHKLLPRNKCSDTNFIDEKADTWRRRTSYSKLLLSVSA